MSLFSAVSSGSGWVEVGPGVTITGFTVPFTGGGGWSLQDTPPGCVVVGRLSMFVTTDQMSPAVQAQQYMVDADHRYVIRGGRYYLADEMEQEEVPALTEDVGPRVRVRACARVRRRRYARRRRASVQRRSVVQATADPPPPGSPGARASAASPAVGDPPGRGTPPTEARAPAWCPLEGA